MASFKVYQKFDSTDIISGKTNKVSSGYFSNGSVYCSQAYFITSSDQTQITSSGGGAYDVCNGAYYTNVYDASNVTSQPLFSLAYGSFSGSAVPAGVLSSPTEAIYNQYRNILLGTPSGSSFQAKSGSGDTYLDIHDIFVIDFSKQMMRDQIDPGQWCISLSGSNGVFSFVDEMPLLTPSQQKENRLFYEIISGSFSSTTNQSVACTYIDGSSPYRGLGMFYPQNGIILLSNKAVVDLVGANVDITTSYVKSSNTIGFFNSINGAGANNNAVMRTRKSEYVPSSHYFIRIKNQDYNFSNNPTFVYQQTDNNHNRGDIIDSLVSYPATYVTTVGLYNDMNELIAVAKLSSPTRKDFESELLLRIRLDF